MSESSDKGRGLEEEIAKLLRKKLSARVERDKRSGAGSHQKMDIKDWWGETRLAIEAKNHQTVKVKEWFRQAEASASVGQIPTVVFACDDKRLALLPFDDLVDLLAELKQAYEKIADLERPLEIENDPQKLVDKATSMKPADKTCRNGHLIAPGATKCLMKGCPYSFSYKAKKEKK